NEHFGRHHVHLRQVRVGLEASLGSRITDTRSFSVASYPGRLAIVVGELVMDPRRDLFCRLARCQHAGVPRGPDVRAEPGREPLVLADSAVDGTVPPARADAEPFSE